MGRDLRKNKIVLHLWWYDARKLKVLENIRPMLKYVDSIYGGTWIKQINDPSFWWSSKY